MSMIVRVWANQIQDSRGEPTIQTEVTLDSGTSAIASVPTGRSVSSFEAFELRDNDPDAFNGRGVTKAIDNVNKVISPQLLGLSPGAQKRVDQIMLELDGTPNKSRLGANAILSVSLAVARAGAYAEGLPLYRYLHSILDYKTPLSVPTPLFNMINGGKHAQNHLGFQEFHVIPDHIKGYSKQFEFGVQFLTRLRSLLERKKLETITGDEGGFAPKLRSNEDALDLLMQVGKVHLGLDIAGEGPNFAGYYEKLIEDYPIILIEDPVGEENWAQWVNLTASLGRKILVVGDDLFATHSDRLKQGIAQKAANAVIVKPNQIGTLTEFFEVCKIAHDSRYTIVVSHRSGETLDPFIADLCVAIGAPFIKAGAPNSQHPERLVKYNRLLEIEKELADDA